MTMPGLDILPAVWPPDPLGEPGWYRGVTLRRIFAYWVDFWILALILVLMHFTLGILTVASLGLLLPLHLLVVPLLVALLYHSLTMSGPFSATVGMRLFGLRVYSQTGGKPTLPQAILHSGLFYLTLCFGFWPLLFALFNRQRRTLHDFAAGLLVLRD